MEKVGDLRLMRGENKMRLSRFLAGPALASFLLASALTPWGAARATQMPPGCNGTGLSINLSVFFAVPPASPGAGGPVSPCEPLVYQANVGPGNSPRCCYEGTLRRPITTPRT